MRIFDITPKIKIVAKSENTRSGFRHRATLMVNGKSVDETTVAYQNRTWERYEFQSALSKLVEKTKELTPMEKTFAKKWIQKGKADMSDFKTTSMVARLGDVMTKNKKESNAWKKRMLIAGLGKKGLSFPKEFDKLPESTKKARLDRVLGIMAGKKLKPTTKPKPKRKTAKKTGSKDWLKQQTQWK